MNVANGEMRISITHFGSSAAARLLSPPSNYPIDAFKIEVAHGSDEWFDGNKSNTGICILEVPKAAHGL